MKQHVAISVTEASQIGEARRAATAIAERAELDETRAGRLAIIVTELATNLVRYGTKGMILLRAEVSDPEERMAEVMAIDSGPGFDTDRAIHDGYSTGGTPGNGLGAVQRLASAFDIYSTRPGGTVIMARVSSSPGLPRQASAFEWACLSRPAPHELVSGDTWGCSFNNGTYAFMIADGLGHGPDASAASEPARVVFENDPFAAPEVFLENAHRALTGTRGSAVAVADVKMGRGILRYSGVGNIAGTLVSTTGRQGLPSHNGIVGARMPRMKVFEYPCPARATLVMHSDGLQTRWSLEKYPGLVSRHPAVIAGILFRDYYRDRDDVTILIGSWNGERA